MTIVETQNPRTPRLIPLSFFDTCLIDGKTKAEITAMYPANGKCVLYLERFDRYLQEFHSITIKDYCIRYGGIVWPKCPGTGKDVAYDTTRGKGLVLRLYAAGGVRKDTSAGFAQHCSRMEEDRKGEKNPVYGKPAWNRGLTAEDSPGVARIAQAQKGSVRPPEAIENMRRGWEKTSHRARRTGPHSEKTKDLIRQETIKRYIDGGMGNERSSIEVKMSQFLTTLPLTKTPVQQHQIGNFIVDFAFPSAKIAIECDGDYFHINPHFYPDGPKDAIQRRNAGRDRAKNTFLHNRGWIVLRFWECDINAGSFKERLLCELRRLGLLSP